jgi:hypothetical protein
VTTATLAQDVVAFTRAVATGDVDGALEIHKAHDPQEFAFALGGLLGGFMQGFVELAGEAPGIDPWRMLVERAEALEL